MIGRVAGVFMGTILSSLVFAKTFVAGKDYTVLPVNGFHDVKSGKVEILEFFSYGCPWCYKLEKPLQNWLKSQKENVTLKRLPVVYHSDWKLYAKAFYAAKLLQKESRLSPALFKAIQEQNQQLKTANAMVQFFIDHGVDKATARSAFDHSPTIELAMKQGLKQMGQYRIQAVPAFVVNGRYKTDLKQARSIERFFAVLHFLVEKAKSEQKSTLLAQ